MSKKADHTCFWTACTMVAIVIGLAVRLYAAWTIQHNTLLDAATVMLMARHMAAGLAFPVFFYGQSYMGSLEPAISAAVSFIAGWSPYAVCVGTVLAGAFVPWLVFLITRMSAGARAGFLATLFVVVGSESMLYYSVHPRGGYMTLLTCGLATLYFGLRSIEALQGGSAKAADRCLLLAAFIAGLGWWSNKMIVVYIGTTALVLVPYIKDICKLRILIPAILLFFLGSLPWWIWNLQNHWASLTFRHTFGKVTTHEGLLGFAEVLPRLLGYTAWPASMTIIRMLVILSFGIAALVILIAIERDHGYRSPPFLALASVFSLIALLLMTYVTSHYSRVPTTRYLLPAFPAFATLIAVCVEKALTRHKAGAVAGLCGLLILFPPMWLRVPALWRHVAPAHENWQRAHALADILQEVSGGIAAGNPTLRWVTVASVERAVISALPNDIYAPYAKRFALNPKQAFVNNYQGVEDFIRRSGGAFDVSTTPGFKVIHDIKPPDEHWAFVPRQALLAVTEAGQSVQAKITAANVDAPLSLMLNPGEPRTIEWELDRPYALCGIKVLNTGGETIPFLSIEGVTATGQHVVLLERTPGTSFFWSGPRLFYDKLDLVQQYRFNPPPEGLVKLSMRIDTEFPDHLQLPAVKLMYSVEPQQKPQPWLNRELAAFILRSGAERLYAPRWIIEHLSPHLSPTIAVRTSSYVTRSVNQLPQLDETGSNYVQLDRPTALLVNPRDADRTQQLLNRHGHPSVRNAAGPHVLFLVDPIDKADNLEQITHLYWTEYGLFEGDGSGRRLDRAHRLYQTARRKQNLDQRRRLLERSLQLAPEHLDAEAAYLQVIRRLEGRDYARQHAQHLQQNRHPSHPVTARFQDGIALLGVEITPHAAHSGQAVEVTYLWQYSPHANPHLWSVFVHFLDSQGNARFQDDHNKPHIEGFLETLHQPFNRTWKYVRTVIIPEDIAGPVNLAIGLVDPNTRLRAKISTDAPARHRALRISDGLEVRATHNAAL